MVYLDILQFLVSNNVRMPLIYLMMSFIELKATGNKVTGLQQVEFEHEERWKKVLHWMNLVQMVDVFYSTYCFNRALLQAI